MAALPQVAALVAARHGLAVRLAPRRPHAKTTGSLACQRRASGALAFPHLGIGSLLGCLLARGVQRRWRQHLQPVAVTARTAPIDTMATVPGDGDSEFVSSVGRRAAATAAVLSAWDSDAAAAGGSAGSAANTTPQLASDNSAERGGGDAARAISEADILQLSGDRLYALSRYSGLTIIDVSNPARAAAGGRVPHRRRAVRDVRRGRHRVRDVQRLVLVRVRRRPASARWQTRAACRRSTRATRRTSSVLADLEVPGYIADSRRVGDVLYVATEEYGYCWGCERAEHHAHVVRPSPTPTALPQGRPAALADAARTIRRRAQHQRHRPAHLHRAATSTTENVQRAAGLDPGGRHLRPGRARSCTARRSASRARSRAAGRWTSTRACSRDQPARRLGHATAARGADLPRQLRPTTSTPLGQPRPSRCRGREQLQSVRFDGTRAYAITAEQTRPAVHLRPQRPRAARARWASWRCRASSTTWSRAATACSRSASTRATPTARSTSSLFDVADLAAPDAAQPRQLRRRLGAASPRTRTASTRPSRSCDDAGPDPGAVQRRQYDERHLRLRYGSGIQLIDFDRDDARPGAAWRRRSATRAARFCIAITCSASATTRCRPSTSPNRDAPVATRQLDVARNVAHGARARRPPAALRQRLVDEPDHPGHDAARPGERGPSRRRRSICRRCSATTPGRAPAAPTGAARSSRAATTPTCRATATATIRTTSDYEQQLTFYVVDLSDRSAPRAVGSFAAEPVATATATPGSCRPKHAARRAQRGPLPVQPDQRPAAVEPALLLRCDRAVRPDGAHLASTFEVPELIAGWRLGPLHRRLLDGHGLGLVRRRLRFGQRGATRRRPGREPAQRAACRAATTW